MSEPVQWQDIVYAEGQARIEYQWLGARDTPGPLLVFLHEGLGSLAMWKEFPERLCQSLGCTGLVYSRPGYGQSQDMAVPHPWGIDFMHRQACAVLPALLTALQVREPPVLLGHSDGASIALLYAAMHPENCRAVIALAPHVLVEPKTLAAIAALQAPEVRKPMLTALGKYHRDAQAVLDRWMAAWLAPDFVAWSITDTITTLHCPVLAVQGMDDEYGTLVHIQTLARKHAATEQLIFDACGHAPHRDQAARLNAAVANFLQHL
jgi:pimeloyl-ACP methyl ester carboxylesterase